MRYACLLTTVIISQPKFILGHCIRMLRSQEEVVMFEVQMFGGGLQTLPVVDLSQVSTWMTKTILVYTGKYSILPRNGNLPLWRLCLLVACGSMLRLRWHMMSNIRCIVVRTPAVGPIFTNLMTGEGHGTHVASYLTIRTPAVMYPTCFRTAEASDH